MPLRISGKPRTPPSTAPWSSAAAAGSRSRSATWPRRGRRRGAAVARADQRQAGRRHRHPQADQGEHGGRRRRRTRRGRRLQQDVPAGTEIQIVRDTSVFIRESVADVDNTLLLGGLLTILIVFLFLNSWRSTVITGPDAADLGHLVVHRHVLPQHDDQHADADGALARHRAADRRRDRRAGEHRPAPRARRGPLRGRARRHRRDRPRGDRHLDVDHRGVRARRLHEGHRRPVLLPVRHHGGLRGAGLAVRVLHARPDAVVALARPGHRADRQAQPVIAALDRFNDWFDRMADGYKRVIAWALDHRPIVVGLALAAFVGGLAVFSLLQTEFLPPFDQGEFVVGFKSAPGASIDRDHAPAGGRSEGCRSSRRSSAPTRASARATRTRSATRRSSSSWCRRTSGRRDGKPSMHEARRGWRRSRASSSLPRGSEFVAEAAGGGRPGRRHRHAEEVRRAAEARDVQDSRHRGHRGDARARHARVPARRQPRARGGVGLGSGAVANTVARWSAARP